MTTQEQKVQALRAWAEAANMIDPSDLFTLDLSNVQLNELGEPIHADAFFKRLVKEKPHFFKLDWQQRRDADARWDDVSQHRQSFAFAKPKKDAFEMTPSELERAWHTIRERSQ